MSRIKDDALYILDRFTAFARSNPGGAQVLLSAMRREMQSTSTIQPTAQATALGQPAKKRGPKPGAKRQQQAQAGQSKGSGSGQPQVVQGEFGPESVASAGLEG